MKCKDTAMGSRQLLLLILSVLTVWVAAQDTKPTEFLYDCRRTGASCLQDAECNINTGACMCEAVEGFAGYNCGLQEDLKAACEANQCENNGECLQEDQCYCGSDTYGAKCENPRVEMWCTDSQMFINVNPHGTFSGNIYLRKDDGTGKSDDDCNLKSVTADPPNLDNYPYVKTVQGDTPTLAGFFIVQNHEPDAADATACQTTAKITDTENQKDYIQQLVINYNTKMLTNVDQIVTLNCSVSKAGGTFTSENAMAVTLDEDDFKPIDVTDTIMPVLFEIRDPNTGTVITNNANLGDPLDLVFTLQVSPGDATDTTIVQFKVTGCNANNGLEGDSAASIEFLEDDCPAEGAEMLFRGQVQQTTEGGEKTTIPLTAFRFVGNSDAVAITCNIKLCTQAEVAANADVCKKVECAGEDGGNGGETDGSNSGGETDGSNSGGETDGSNSGGETDGSNSGGETDGGASDESNGGSNSAPGRRRKRSAEDEGKLTQTINVSSPLESGQTGSGGTPEKNVKDEDCMQHSEVVIIIVIFTVILFLLVLSLVIVVVNLLRSRQKVVNASVMSADDTHSRYTLPRLSVATTM